MSISALRTWFRVFGVLLLLGGIGQFAAALNGASNLVVALALGFVMVAFSLSYFYVSQKFPYFLQTSTIFVQRLLYFTVGFSLVSIPMLFTFQHQPEGDIAIPLMPVVMWILVPLWLLYNVKRIEEEHILEDD